MINSTLINPFPTGTGINEATVSPPIGLAYIAAVLEQNGFQCTIIDANLLQLSNKEIVNRIPKETILIGMYVNSFTYDAVKTLSSIFRRDFKDVIIILGGPLTTAAPEMVLHEIQCDGVIRGEGEYAVLRIMRNISDGMPAFSEDVSGATYFDRKNKNIIHNPISRITNLDELPFPAYHLLPSFKFYKSRSRKNPVAPLVTSRGCVYDCIFCSKDVFERKITFRSAQNVLDEIDYLIKHYGVRQIDIFDDNFAFNRKRMIKVLDGIIERDYKLAINFQVGIRTELLDEFILEKMKQAGVFKLGFGIESADEKVLNICHKKIDLDKVKNIVNIAKKKKFVIYGFFIVGLPGETEEAFQNTLDYARNLDFDVANFCMAIPFVGTELYRMIKENGRFLIDTTRNINSGFYNARVFYEYGNETEASILKRYNRAYKEFYSFNKKLKLLRTIHSFEELRWHWNITLMVIKGIIRSRLKRIIGKEITI